MSATPSDAAAGSVPAGDSISAIIELYKKDVDRSLLRSRLALTPEQRLIELMRMQRLVAEVARAGRETRRCAREADA